MRLRNIPEADEILFNSKNYVIDGTKKKGNWNTQFKNDNPIHLEIGCGKGDFIVGMANQNLNINYIALEKYSSVILKAVKKALNNYSENLFFLKTDAALLTEIFSEGEVSQVYLNFSDPWPKARHYKRRLTYSGFLNTYKSILKPNGELQLKTDNRALFDFSIEELNNSNWDITVIEYDLHKSSFSENNIMTEYEKRFSSQGNPIYMLRAIAPSK